MAIAVFTLGASISEVRAAPERCAAAAGIGASRCDGEPIARLDRSTVMLRAPAPERPRLQSIDSLTRPRSRSLDLGQAGAHGSRLDRRSMALLRKEIAGLHRLMGMTPTSSTELPELLQRLGDGYVELEQAAERDRADFERRARVFADHHRTERASELRREAQSSAELAQLARRGAIDAFSRRIDLAPLRCEPARSERSAVRCGDDVTYRLAGALVRAGETERASQAFSEIGRRWPRSPFAARAALGHAELSFEAARADPTLWPRAESAFRRLVGRLPAGSATRAFAAYKLGHVLWHQGEFEAATKQLARAMKASSAARVAQAAPPGFREALAEDLVSVFAVHGHPTDAYELFVSVAPSREGAMRLLERLGQTYLDVGLYHRAEQTYSDLIHYNGGASACGYQAKAAYARIAADPSDRAGITKRLRELVRTQRTFRALGLEPGLRDHCRIATASLLGETALRWHASARGAASSGSVRDVDALADAARLYRLLLTTFDDEDLRRVPWSAATPNHPLSHGALRLALADVALARGQWHSCGGTFDRVRRSKTATAAQRQDAVLGAAECYLRAYEAASSHERAAWTLPATGELSTAETSGLEAFDRYACRVRPPSSPGAGAELHGRILLARGALHAKAGRLQRSAAALRRAALESGRGRAGAAAGVLYLDALARRGSDPDDPEPACFDHAERDLAILQQRFCRGADLVRHAEHCRRFARVEYDLAKSKAEALLARCERGGSGSQATCLASAELYVHVWKTQGQAACLARAATCRSSASLLYYGARAFEAGARVDRANELRRILVDDRFHLADTPYAERALADLAASYEAQGQRARAAAAYERLARSAAERARSSDALTSATRLRLDLGQLDRALRHARSFHRRFSRAAPRRTAAVSVAVADRLALAGRWNEAQRLVALAAPAIRSAGTLDVRILAQAVLGRASLGLGQGRRAAQAYQRVAESWRDERACLNELAQLGGPAHERRRQHARVVAAVAESLLFIGEQRRRSVAAAALPPFRGPASRRGVERHVATTLVPWIAEQRRAIDAAEEAYTRVLSLDRGAPPPAHALAARLSLGRMWADLVLKVRSAPHPRRWNRSGYVPGSRPPLLWAELRAAFRERLWAESLIYEPRATAANIECVHHGARQGRQDAVRICQQRLAELAPEGPGPIERLAAMRSTFELLPRPIEVDGKPLAPR
ncbi:MAG: hypothetical protein JRI23_11500 [Deltaproteobacteria bacterium]|jgi:tetratricopeptide (TPR) repeat protein|nr:hypothetical protein [Deltaproteobacteria bacterium]MBW2532323.1 hypothetical protein [Deltaproteobacteria bacterium]